LVVGLGMAFADFSSSELKAQGLPHTLLDIHGPETEATDQNGGATGYRIRLAFLFVSSVALWGAIFATARLIFG